MAHGLLIPFLGFYWDDWPMIWFAETQGPLGFPGAFSGDRPFLSIIYVVTTFLLESTPIAWQLLGLVSRWLLGITAWWFIREMWPQKTRLADWLGILIVIFPGFKQQPISVVYGNGLILLVSYFASYALMIKAMRRESVRAKVLLFGASLLTYGFCLFSTEYYVGLDILRGLVIWLILRRTLPSLRQQVWQGLKTWSPYLAMLFIFLIWRVFIFEFPTYQPVLMDAIPENGIAGLLSVLFRMAQDSFTAGWLAWSSIFKFPSLPDFSTTSGVLFWVVVLAGAAAAFVGLLLGSRLNTEGRSDEAVPHKEIFLMAGVALLAAGFPFWITGLPIQLTYPYDRFLLAFMLGSCLLLIGLLEWLIKTNHQRIILLSLVIGFSIGANFENANSYRREWLTHTDLFWQLSWRAPAIREGTILLTYSLPFQYYSDNSLTAPLNLLYAPENTTLELDYYLAMINVRLGRSIPALEKGLEIYQDFRNAGFTGSTSDALVFFYSPPGCLRILDPARDSDLPVLPIEYRNVIHLSNLDQILPDPSLVHTPSNRYFGAEPAHDWCYYFEQADLAGQQHDWQAAVDWIEDAVNAGHTPAEPSEWIIYMEGLFNLGEWQKAAAFTESFYFDNPGLQKPVCSLLARTASNKPDALEEAAFQDLLETTDCQVNK